MLKTRTAPQDGLTDFDEMSGFISTPFKNLSGQLSWRETACLGHGVGVPYRNSQRSSDGFCTVDVQLVSFNIASVQKPPGSRYIRLEIHPGGSAAALCAAHTISVGDTIRFGGIIKKDRHLGQREWLEVHVSSDLAVVPPSTLSDVNAARLAQTHLVQIRDSLSRIAERAYGRQNWVAIYRVNRIRIKNPNLIYPGQVFIIPELPPRR